MRSKDLTPADRSGLTFADDREREAFNHCVTTLFPLLKQMKQKARANMARGKVK